jgi:hypothetical protein
MKYDLDFPSFIEDMIVGGVMRMLGIGVNELLEDWDMTAPLLDHGGNPGGVYIAPKVELTSCERTEKERIIRIDAYTVTITFAVPESEYADEYCYAYSNAVDQVLAKDCSLDGTADRTVVTHKKFIPPKHENCGEDWGLVLTLRVTVEGKVK